MLGTAVKNSVILGDDEFEIFVRDWIGRYEKRIHDAGGDRLVIDKLLDKMIEEGMEKSMSPMEITDYFCISWPGIVDNYNFLKIKKEEIIEIFDVVMKRKAEEWSK